MSGDRTTNHDLAPLDCTPIVWAAVEKYVQARETLERAGSANKRQLEECRSYAVEALQALLFENPTLCNYRRRMDAVIADGTALTRRAK